MPISVQRTAADSPVAAVAVAMRPLLGSFPASSVVVATYLSVSMNIYVSISSGTNSAAFSSRLLLHFCKRLIGSSNTNENTSMTTAMAVAPA